MTNIQEIWKPIKNYEGLYEVSNFGSIRSLDRTVKAAIRNNNFIKRKGRDITPKYTQQGYQFVLLYKDGVSKSMFIHRIVAIEFLDNTDLKLAVNHKDLVKSNNNVLNLEWVTYKENKAHAMENNAVAKGESCGASILKESDVIFIRSQHGLISGKKLAKKLSISDTNIYDIWNRRTWKHI